jgi:hypothetical protein
LINGKNAKCDPSESDQKMTVLLTDAHPKGRKSQHFEKIR